MHKFRKYLPVSILWFAWIILSVHLMIPHDHHLVESLVSQEESCPASHKSPNNHPFFPFHCHAFNDLASEKASTFVLNVNFQSHAFLFYTLSNASFFDYQIATLTFN